MVCFLSVALDQAKEEIASGSKEALTDFNQLKREVREREAEFRSYALKSITRPLK